MTGRTLRIGWLYPTKMNIYGDRGNVIVLAQRARWRGIEPVVIDIGIGDPIPPGIDVFFWGGGQDGQQVACAHDIAGAKGEELRNQVEAGAALLAVCGGYQLLGHRYLPHDADPLPGIGLFDVETVAGPERFIGNVVVDSQWGDLVGFENHSGLTTLGPAGQAMGTVRVGRGNNGRDGTEGAIYRNAVGCYLHGSLLPKNPALADWLIERGLGRHGDPVTLAPLGDTLEMAAHQTAVDRAVKTR